jgi:RHS repeat-associated protein
MFGFGANGYGYIDNLTIKSWNTSTSAFDITEHVDEFTTNGSNYAEEAIDYDRNGNLIYDGVQKYSYDAWNRMVAIAHAYRSSGTVSAGQSSVTMKYDGKGRRIQKAISNTGAWDCTYKYYYDNDSCIEERNGSDYVIKENTWGTNYIDELVQVKAESDGTLSTSALSGTDGRFFACQDANYNVLGLVNASGALVERYEYSPYGQRKVFASPGTNDPGNYAPTLSSQRASSTAAWAKNEFGHQGLMHDEEIDLVYNRARHLHPGLGRFAQRDPIGYVDGMSPYQYVESKPLQLVDPSGTKQWWGLYCGTDNPPGPPWPPAKDDLDQACFDHDMCYGKGGYSGWGSQVNNYPTKKNCPTGPSRPDSMRECDRALYNAALEIMYKELDKGNGYGEPKTAAARNIANAFRQCCGDPTNYEKKCCPPKEECAGR